VRHVFARAAAKAGANKVTDFLGLSTDLLTLRAFLDIGKIPPTIEGVRVRRGVADEIVMEWSVKVAGDGFRRGRDRFETRTERCDSRRRRRRANFWR
jgi:hypothetical protein